MNARHQQRRQAAQRERLSLTDPRFNLREIAKQMVLLEDHLTHPDKQCLDCIRKHLLTIEAFAEETCALDTDGSYLDTGTKLTELAKIWLESVADDQPLAEIAQDIRVVRKLLVPLVADPRGAANRVASRYMETCPHRGSIHWH